VQALRPGGAELRPFRFVQGPARCWTPLGAQHAARKRDPPPTSPPRFPTTAAYGPEAAATTGAIVGWTWLASRSALTSPALDALLREPSGRRPEADSTDKTPVTTGPPSQATDPEPVSSSKPPVATDPEPDGDASGTGLDGSVIPHDDSTSGPLYRRRVPTPQSSVPVESPTQHIVSSQHHRAPRFNGVGSGSRLTRP
jgi:hypothetical protein